MSQDPVTGRWVVTPDERAVVPSSLEGLPCGCVVGVYQMGALPVRLAIVEVRGPYCVFDDHRAGALGTMAGSGDGDEEREISGQSGPTW